MKVYTWVIVLAATLFSMQTAMAEDCDEMMEDVRKEIERNKDDYERDAIREANRHLADAAKALRDDEEVECKASVRKANRKLRRGED